MPVVVAFQLNVDLAERSQVVPVNVPLMSRYEQYKKAWEWQPIHALTMELVKIY